MIQALLVDLDDTLIENDVARFIPAYFDLLATDLSAFGPKDAILGGILAGTKAMLSNEDPRRTLAQVFYESFRATTGAEPAKVAVVLERFYAETYRRLESLTRQKARARDLLRAAAGRGLQLAVATNPLMIRTAIEHRLAWGGIPVDSFDYALITDVEMFHFSKPRPAYFAEALAYLGRLPSEAVMIGNDPAEDLEPASVLGLPVFQVTAEAVDGRPGGDLAEAARWLADDPRPSASAETAPQALIARFEGQLAALLTKVRLLGEAGMRLPATQGGLAPIQIVCHLRDVDQEINLPRLKVFLKEQNPFFSSVDTDDWIEQRDYIRENPASAVAGFVEARMAVTSALRALSPDAWQRRARHSLLGPVTLAEWIAVLAEHDLRHVAQVHAPLDRRLPPDGAG